MGENWGLVGRGGSPSFLGLRGFLICWVGVEILLNLISEPVID